MTTLQAEATTQRTELPAGSWQLDPAHSQVGFSIEYMTGRFRGSFAPVEASLTVSEEGEARLRGSAKAENIKVQDENLQAHLLSPEFFDAERSPKLSFSSAAIATSNSEISIDGMLSINGFARPVMLTGTFTDQITDAYGRKRFGINVEGEVDRHEFGLNWNIQLPNGQPALADEVMLNAELYFLEDAS